MPSLFVSVMFATQRIVYVKQCVIEMEIGRTARGNKQHTAEKYKYEPYLNRNGTDIII